MKRSIWPIDGSLAGYTTQGQSGPGSNDNVGVHNPWSSQKVVSPSDTV